MFALSMAQLRAHRSRLVATCLAIIIAVGFVVATLVLDQTTKATVSRAAAAQYQDADAVISTSDHGSGDVSLSQKLADRIQAVPGVRAVALDRSASLQVRLPDEDGYQSAQLTAVAIDQALRWQRLAAGRLPTAAGELAIGEERGVKLGSRLSLLVSPPGQAGGTANPVARTGLVVGIVDLAGATGDDGPGNDQLFASQSQAIAWGATDFDAIRVAGSGASPATLVSRIRATLTTTERTGLTVRTGAAATKQAIADFTRGAATLTEVLLVFATIAVLVCGLVIANTFAVLLAQRTKELALLRCVGASGRQLRRGVLLESLIIGAVASAAGVLAGIGCAAMLSAVARHFHAPIPLAGLTVPVRAVLIGLAVGIVVTMLAAFLPARRATRVAPLAALRVQDPPPPRSRAGLLRRAAGVVLLVPSALVLAKGAADGQLIFALAGGAVSFLAFLLLAQWLVPPTVALAGRLTGPSGGVPGRLAASNALRNPQRTAATATALIIGVTLTAAMVVGAASTRATASTGLDNAFPTDVVIQNSAQGSLPAGIDRAVTAVPNVQAALAVPSAQVRGPGSDDVTAFGVDPARAGSVVRSTLQIPAPGTVNATAWVLSSWGLGDGQRVRLRVGSRALELRIHAVHSDSPLMMTAADLAKLAPKAGIGAVWVRLADGLNAGGRSTALDGITRAAADQAPSSFVRGAFQDRDSFNRIVTTLLLVVTGLLAIAVAIAVIGVGNTMALSVLERRQESGLLRALGLTRGQLRLMLLWEAVLIAGVASLLGTALGVGYGVLGTSAALSGQTSLQVAVPWWQLLLIVAVATGAGALASVLPSRRAARTSPVAAIAA